MSKNTIIIIFLLQIILYSLVWFWDEYIASYITIVFPAIIGFILLVSWIVELIEPSKVPSSYFVVMTISVLAPLLTGITFYMVYGGSLDWLEGI